MVMLIIFFAIMITVICRRRRQRRLGYVVVRGQNVVPGSVVVRNNAQIAQVCIYNEICLSINVSDTEQMII